MAQFYITDLFSKSCDTAGCKAVVLLSSNIEKCRFAYLTYQKYASSRGSENQLYPLFSRL